MTEQSNNPLNLWQELKRRKVFRVIVMYAGAAYIIIELVNNVVRSFPFENLFKRVNWWLKRKRLRDLKSLCLGFLVRLA